MEAAQNALEARTRRELDKLDRTEEQTGDAGWVTVLDFFGHDLPPVRGRHFGDPPRKLRWEAFSPAEILASPVEQEIMLEILTLCSNTAT
jgi:hypothetical protein